MAILMPRGVLCWAALGLSVAISCQRRYVSYFHICVGRGIGGRTCEVHDVHEARGLRGAWLLSSGYAQQRGRGRHRVRVVSYRPSALGYCRLSNVERCRQQTRRGDHDATVGDNASGLTAATEPSHRVLARSVGGGG